MLSVICDAGSKGRVGAILSPDGRYIAATTVDGEKLFLFEVPTQKWTELAKASVGAIQWSADNKYVYFDTQSTAEPASIECVCRTASWKPWSA